jgi:sugar lactone lactonase YvrE
MKTKFVWGTPTILKPPFGGLISPERHARPCGAIGRKLLIRLWAMAIISLLPARVGAQITVSTAVTNSLNEPYNVAEDADGNIYIADSANDRLVRIDASTQAASTLAGVPGVPGANDGPNAGFNPAHFSNPQGLLLVSLNGTNGLLVADSGNNLIRFVRLNDGYTVTLAGNTNPPTGPANATGLNASFNVPVSLDQDANGNVYIADEFDNAIRVMNLNDPNLGVTNLTVTGTTFHHPNAVAFMGTNQLWVSDSYNNAVKLITLTSPVSGTLTTYLGSNTHQQSPGFQDNAFGPAARLSNPGGLLWVNGVGLLISDTGNNVIRLATNNPVYGSTNYSVVTFAGTPGTPGFANGAALSATFNQPFGLCADRFDNAFLVADLANNAIRRIQNGQPLPPVPTPAIGWVKFQFDPATGQYLSVLQTGSPFVFNNDVTIEIAGTPGTQTHIEFGPTPSNPLVDSIPDPSPTVGTTPPAYQDGLTPEQVAALGSALPSQPDVTIKAIGFQSGRQNSAIATARFQFQAATPNIIGDNAAQFTVTDITTNAMMYYTTDGTDPTNGPPSIGPISSGQTLSLQVTSNLTFKVAAFKPGYANSSVTTKVFSTTNFVPNQITFGFAAGEASSDFVAAPGQTFIAPVTLTVLPGTVMYSLQFNLMEGPGLTNPGPAIAPDGYSFQSMLMQSGVNSPSFEPFNPVQPFEPIPPAMFLGLLTNVIPTTSYVTNMDLVFTNLVSAGSESNVTVVNTTYHFTYSVVTNYYTAPWGTQFPIGTVQTNVTAETTTFVTNGVTVTPTNYVLYFPPPIPVPGVEFVLLPPVNPPPNDVVIYPYGTNTPFVSLLFTNASSGLLGVGWLERHGESYLYNTLSQDLITYSMAHDVLHLSSAGQVEVGAYSLHIPTNAALGQTYQIQIGRPSATSDGIGAPGSSVYIQAPTNGPITAVKTITLGQRKYLVGDAYPFRWFNAGDFGDTNLNNADVEQVFQSALYHLDTPPTNSDFFDAMDSCGYYGVLDGQNGWYTNSAANALFDGNDSSINGIMFGDGRLDVCDVYVTFRRSLDPSLTWYRRFWENGQRVAEPVGNYVPNSLPQFSANARLISPAAVPTVNFTAGDVLAAAGQTVQIPITASVFGGYPLRVTMLNLSVVPLDGSPALTNAISFTPGPALGTPILTDSSGPGNYAAAWLNSTIAGISSNGVVGVLVVTIPASATSQSAYAVHFDEASGSPNGLASFTAHTMTGLITLSSRTNSSYGDGIPDSWRLRWFGTVNNLLSVSNACPSGDGVNNWQKYVAGVDPNVANDFPSVNVKTPPAGATAAIHWPSVSGKQYVILRSASLFPGHWTAIATNTGTGTDMEFDDTTGGPTRFYRVQILP